MNPQATIFRFHEVLLRQRPHVAVADASPTREQEHVPREIAVGRVVDHVGELAQFLFRKVHLLELRLLRTVPLERAERDGATEHGKHHHAFQAVDMSDYGSWLEPLDGAHVHVEILDEVPVNLLDGHIRKAVLILQEHGEVAVSVRVLVIGVHGTVHTYAQGVVTVVFLKQLHDGVLRFRLPLVGVLHFLSRNNLLDVFKFVETLAQQQ